MFTNSNGQNFPLNCNIFPSHPFPNTSYEELENVLRLREDCLGFDTLQASSVSFDVPLTDDRIGNLTSIDILAFYPHSAYFSQVLL